VALELQQHLMLVVVEVDLVVLVVIHQVEQLVVTQVLAQHLPFQAHP
jgi:hypothetical protein